MKAKTLREQDQEQLRDRLFELRGELSKLRDLAARGMIQKQAGKINRGAEGRRKGPHGNEGEGNLRMIDLIGKRVAVVQCSDPGIVGVEGIFALETMKTITILSGSSKRTVPKVGTVLQAPGRRQDSGRRMRWSAGSRTDSPGGPRYELRRALMVSAAEEDLRRRPLPVPRPRQGSGKDTHRVRSCRSLTSRPSCFRGSTFRRSPSTTGMRDGGARFTPISHRASS